jgi:hypothetical protein
LKLLTPCSVQSISAMYLGMAPPGLRGGGSH